MPRPWQNTNKLCAFVHALTQPGAPQFSLLVDAHDTMLQSTASEALERLRSAAGDQRILIEDEARTKVAEPAYEHGQRWNDAAAVVHLRGGALQFSKLPWAARDGLDANPSVNFELGVACGQPVRPLRSRRGRGPARRGPSAVPRPAPPFSH